MAIQNVSSTNSTATSNQPSQTLPNQTVTKDDFLKLLIAQLQNQDPLQPMDNQQFAVQLATFNSLEQLIDINKQLGSLQSTQGLTNQFNAASLIGKEIATTGNTISLQSGSLVPVSYQLGANATRVVVNIQDSSGSLVRQLEVGAQKAGDQTITWDGKDASGKAAASGLYTFEINAFDLNGKQVQASGRIHGIVTGARWDGSEPVLELGNVQVPLSSVTTVRSGS
jgi:flagellar basal-body rod modification protein FlgD